MSRNQITSLNSIDISSLTFEDIRWKYGVFRPTSTGSGRDKKYSSWNGVQTPLGEIEEKLWYQLAETLIQQKGEQQLFHDLLQWESEHNYTNATSAEVRKEALHLHASRIFDNPQWVSFVAFNRRYRPEVLETAHLVTVVNTCCQKPGEVTQEQIDAASNGEISCPHCGRWSPFAIAEQSQADGHQIPLAGMEVK